MEEPTLKQLALRYNKGKTELSLLPAKACVEEAKVWQFGEKKYGRDNWKKLYGPDTVQKVMDSLLRHAFAILDGQMLDEETGLEHAAHIRCNAAMIIEFNQREILNDNPDVKVIDGEQYDRQWSSQHNPGTGHFQWIKRETDK